MYISKLTMKETQKAIKVVKDSFENILARAFNLDRVSAPIIVEANKAINDDLGIKDSALKFNIVNLGYPVEVVQSLAKWKRMALFKYGYQVYEGIYTDMNAIRQHDEIDNTHSLYVDQWDWEFIIKENDRTLDFLMLAVKKIVKALVKAKSKVNKMFPVLKETIKEEVYFISSEELFQKYPHLTAQKREREITKKHRTVFVMQIGESNLKGEKHDLRAPDYDDWKLNGDLLLWSDVLQEEIELSSMGIRVDKKSLLKQMKTAERLDELNKEYYQQVIKGELPLTIGGGIGQSRMCMILLEKYHIAEVQASVWRKQDLELFKKIKLNYL
ncbi:MAG TPA: aspartate--ammonia ligase [Acholeplasmataceae bacterium]|nr:aspartate--ammonia ligase [Acholeplasmataceae bacterium]